MSFCELLCASLFNKVKVCGDCEGWFLEQTFRTASGLCDKCHTHQEQKIFDHANKRLKASAENLTDLTQGYKKKKKCPQESPKSSETPTA